MIWVNLKTNTDIRSTIKTIRQLYYDEKGKIFMNPKICSTIIIQVGNCKTPR